MWAVSLARGCHKEARTETCNYSKRAEFSKSSRVAHGLSDKKSIWTEAPLGLEHSVDQRVSLPITQGHRGGKARTKAPRRIQLPQVWCWWQDSFSAPGHLHPKLDRRKIGKHAGAAPTLTLTSIVAGFNVAEVQCYSFSGTVTVREKPRGTAKATIRVYYGRRNGRECA